MTGDPPENTKRHTNLIEDCYGNLSCTEDGHRSFRAPVVRNAILGALLWSLIVGASLTWAVYGQQQQTLTLAVNAARANFNKDQAYRLWASRHGGVYVAPDERTPPNPYLAHVPERDVVTKSGKKLTLMNPAYMLRQMMTEYSDLYGVKSKITGKIVLNPINRPDDWELAAIDAFERGSDEVMESSVIDGKPYLRLMRPMMMEQSCVKCHGHLGFKVGDIRGGVSISVPMSPYVTLETQAIRQLEGTHFTVWLVGLAGITVVSRRSWNVSRERQRVFEQMRLAARVFENGLEGVVITDADGTILRVNPMFTEITGYSAEEAIGKTPRILKSHRHDPAFYAQLWQTLNTEDKWEGEIWNRRKDGVGFLVWETIATVRDAEENILYYVALFRDVTEQKASEERIAQLAYYDVLTSLPNRTLFTDRLGQAISRAKRHQSRLALIFIDIDNFKGINDTLGHPAGDDLLRILAGRIGSNLREEDTVARLGGDEFVVLLENIADDHAVQRAIETIMSAIAQPANLDGQETFVSASVGISLYPDDGDTTDLLIKNADTAMYRAKDNRNNQYRFYTAEMSAQAEQRFRVANELRIALEKGQFELHYQPLYCLKRGRIIGAEALVRWRHPERGLILPGEFISLAEETGLITPIGERVLEHACGQLRQWLDTGKRPLRISVNVSPLQIQNSDLLGTVKRIVSQHRIPPHLLELEITEGAIMNAFDNELELLTALREYGVGIAMDDFGTGYSSLASLKKLPIEHLKIDRSFILGLPDNDEDRTITTTILRMASTLGLAVIAEGVETEAQLKLLKSLGCDAVQGYLISKPLPADRLEALLAEQQISTSVC